MKKIVHLFLDSGAYSAFSKGEEVDIYSYIDFVKEHLPYLDLYANLDVIGDAKATYDNQKIMEKAGLNPVPTFHYGEDWKYLHTYIKDYDYIALGGVAQMGKNMNQLVEWLDNCFTRICDDEGYPKVKVHGFAVTTLPLMMRYPWFSVDSTSWVLTGRYGSIYVPRKRGDKYIYDENTWKVSVSDRASGVIKEGKHIKNFTRMEREQILEYIEMKGFRLGESELRQETEDYKLKEGERWWGKEEADSQREVKPFRSGFVVTGWKEDHIVEIVKEAGVSNDYRQRDEINIIYFIDLEENSRPWPWPFKKKKPRGFLL